MDAGGTINNTASVTTARTPAIPTPPGHGGAASPIVLDKVATVPGGPADVAGQVISYAIGITNDGNVTLTGATVTDPSVSELAGGHQRRLQHRRYRPRWQGRCRDETLALYGEPYGDADRNRQQRRRRRHHRQHRSVTTNEGASSSDTASVTVFSRLSQP